MPSPPSWAGLAVTRSARRHSAPTSMLQHGWPPGQCGPYPPYRYAFPGACQAHPKVDPAAGDVDGYFAGDVAGPRYGLFLCHVALPGPTREGHREHQIVVVPLSPGLVGVVDRGYVYLHPEVQ